MSKRDNMVSLHSFSSKKTAEEALAFVASFDSTGGKACFSVEKTAPKLIGDYRPKAHFTIYYSLKEWDKYQKKMTIKHGYGPSPAPRWSRDALQASLQTWERLRRLAKKAKAKKTAKKR